MLLCRILCQCYSLREMREQKETDLRREERLLTTLRDAEPAVPQAVTI